MSDSSFESSRVVDPLYYQRRNKPYVVRIRSPRCLRCHLDASERVYDGGGGMVGAYCEGHAREVFAELEEDAKRHGR